MRAFGLFLLLTVVGCGSSGAYFDASGFHSAENPYSIRYAQAASGVLISSEWRVANFEYEDGQPSHPITRGEFESALTWVYRDGVAGTVRTETFDLKLSHNTNAAIWVRMLPIPFALLHKKVAFLAENFVNNLSGNVYNEYFGIGPAERRVATQILESKAIGFFGLPAQMVRFDLVSVDQLELDPNAPRTRVEMVLVRTRFVKTLHNGQTFRAPAYLLIGYSNDAVRFDSQLADFRRFASQIEFGQGR